MKTGWKEKLTPLTTRQMVDCYDTVGTMEQMYKWAMYGLGLKSLEDFDKSENQYSVEEIGEISVAVVEASDRGKNPTSKA